MKHILTNSYHEILRFEKDEEVFEGILNFVKKEKITAGWIWGIGAAQETTLAFYDLDKKEYNTKIFKEPLEVLGISGSVAVKNGEPALHMHGVFGKRDFSSIGGHIEKLLVLATMEIFIHKIDGKINRELDEKIGLNLMCKAKPYAK